MLWESLSKYHKFRVVYDQSRLLRIARKPPVRDIIRFFLNFSFNWIFGFVPTLDFYFLILKF